MEAQIDHKSAIEITHITVRRAMVMVILVYYLPRLRLGRLHP